jgi:hypothetical protein
VLLVGCSFFSSQGFSFQFYSNRISGHSIHDRISKCWIVNVLIPLGYGKLGGDDDAFPPIAVLQELQQCQADLLGHGLQSKIIQDDQALALQVVE